MVRLITWNVAGRSKRLGEQAMAIAARAPDIVALQEVTRRTRPLWERAFELMGLTHVCASSRGSGQSGGAVGRRTLVMIAARVALEEVQEPLAVPRPESALSVLARSSPGPLEVHCVHVPNAANGWVKVETLQALRRRLETPSRAPRVLCGDLNTPRRELPDGTTISFARDSRGRLRAERGPEWDAAELGIVPGLREVGYRDAFRTRHGYASRSPSWTWKTIAGHDGGWRLDHTFLSAELLPLACQYHHQWREQGLSDHSALETDLEYNPG
ncbi:MAG: endonuclease/exonuclease/phosphatase family protein [Solirubrobacterales bacterium]|nr:endonuclease/exonuclease/phosphatase family protein [Solirubrobacterales bacterium]MBV9423088.1 endonuclease/exonuclease/phosphatase family protein [Solirubrobacterales bacterium]MBV9796464.1 endonuclease/exonuclease/phosphatase family protein [Solirubrobacterales bacterium]